MTPRTTNAARQMEQDRIPDWKLAYSLDEAAAATSYGESTLRLKIALGELEARKDGQKVIIERDELKRFIAALPKVQPSKLRAAG